MTTLQDGIVLMLEETFSILDGGQDLARVDEDDHSRIHEQCRIVPIMPCSCPSTTLSKFNSIKENSTAVAYKVSGSSEWVHH